MPYRKRTDLDKSRVCPLLPDFRWKDQFNLSLDPERAEEYYRTTNKVDANYCTMCGPNFCAARISHTLCDETK
jgi:phosphomethylpyrimidine synthase